MTQELICPSCHSINDPHQDSCSECGEDLSSRTSDDVAATLGDTPPDGVEAPLDLHPAQTEPDAIDSQQATLEPQDADQPSGQSPLHEDELPSEPSTSDDEDHLASSDDDHRHSEALDAFEEESPADGAAEPEASQPTPEPLQPTPPPELAAILNPQRGSVEPLAPLPKPGPYSTPASLTVFLNGHQIDQLHLNTDVLVLRGSGEAPETAPHEPAYTDSDEPEVEQHADELPDEPLGHEDSLAIDMLADEGNLYSDDLDLHASLDLDDEGPAKELPLEALATLTPQDDQELVEAVEDQPQIDVDLDVYAPDAGFAHLQAYIFRRNKNYTLFVTSDTGTQLNQEVLRLGDRRPLRDGDIVVLNQRLAMRLSLPASS